MKWLTGTQHLEHVVMAVGVGNIEILMQTLYNSSLLSGLITSLEVKGDKGHGH